jgi:hypothetical protein
VRKLISEKTFQAIEMMLETGGRSYSEIAAAVGVGQTLVCTIAERKHYYQCNSAERSRRRKRRPSIKQIYLPTPEQIETECAHLRAIRKPGDVADPEAYDPEAWTPPVVSFGTLD